MTCTRFIAGSAGVLLLSGSAVAQTDVLFHSRLLVQEVSGTGTSRVVTTLSDGSSIPVVMPGARLRYTLQFRLEDLNPTSPDGPVTGLASMLFNIRQTAGGAGSGFTARSYLTTAAGGVGVNEDSTQSLPGSYPSQGESTIRSGFHRWSRSGVSTDTSYSNGGFGGLEPLATNVSGNLVPLLALSGISNPGQDFTDPSAWYGLYSFEFQTSALFVGEIEYAFRPPGTPDGPTSATNFLYWRDSLSTPTSGTAVNSGFATLATVRVLVVPAPGAACTLTIMGLCAAPRRRARRVTE